MTEKPPEQVSVSLDAELHTHKHTHTHARTHARAHARTPCTTYARIILCICTERNRGETKRQLKARKIPDRQTDREIGR